MVLNLAKILKENRVEATKTGMFNNGSVQSQRAKSLSENLQTNMKPFQILYKSN